MVAWVMPARPWVPTSPPTDDQIQDEYLDLVREEISTCENRYASEVAEVGEAVEETKVQKE